MNRLLTPVADVRRGEATTALALAAYGGLVLCAYYVLKTAREPLILADGGAEVKAYATAAQLLLLLPVVVGYDAVARRLGRMPLLAVVTLFFASHVPLFHLASAASLPVSIPFYLWVGVLSLVVIAQFWAFAADVYGVDQGRRLFAVLGVGCCLGALIGAQLSKMLLSEVGTLPSTWVGAALLITSLLPAFVVHRRERAAARPIVDRGALEPSVDSVRLVLGDRYLRGIAVFTVVVSGVATLGEYVLDRIVLDTAHARGADVSEFVGAFKADLYAWTSLLALFIALFVVSRVFRTVGLRAALLIPVVIALGGYGLLAVLPLLSIVAAVKVAEGAVAVSLHNTARQSLYLGTSQSARYRAKAVIDTVLWRAGDVLAALVVFAGSALGLGVRELLFVTVGLAALWLSAVAVVTREHRRRIQFAIGPADAE